MNKEIEAAIQYVDIKDTRKKIWIKDKELIRYWDARGTYDWEDLCDFSKQKFNGIKTVKLALGILTYLLDNDLYEGKYKEELHKDRENIFEFYNNFRYTGNQIFTINYLNVNYVEIGEDRRIFVRILSEKNPNMKKIYLEFISETNKENHLANNDIDFIFTESIGEKDIKSYKDIDSNTFWNQIEFYKSIFREDENHLDKALKNVCKFYRWLVSKYPDYHFFSNSHNLTNEMVFSTSLIRNIKYGYYFTKYDDKEDLSDRPKICFIVKNMERYSTVLAKNSHFLLDSSVVEYSFYRIILNKYVQNQTTVSFIHSAQISMIVSALHFLEEIKKQDNYPNPNMKYFTVQEAYLLKNFYVETGNDVAVSSLNNRIGAVRRFLIWCRDCDHLLFEETFFDYLSQYEEPNKTNGDSIPDEDLEKINEVFLDSAKKDNKAKLMYCIFLLLIETEFRISQVCHLKADCLQPTLKNDQYLVYSNTKVSHGRKSGQVISKNIKHILSELIKETEELRNQCLLESYKNSIFLYKRRNGSVTLITSELFLDYFQKICQKADVRRYNSLNLRDTHMTKAFEYVLKTGKSNMELSILSKHKNIDTTKNHYIEIELTKLLESTYKVTLSGRIENPDDHILKSIPGEYGTNESLVENGCGHCKAKICHLTTNLPCLICKDFITTPQHKPYFIKMISKIDMMVKQTSIKHELEDLNLIKTIYVQWLKEIYLKEEEMCWMEE